MDANYVIAMMHVIDKQTTIEDLEAFGKRIAIDRERYGVDAESLEAIRAYFRTHKATLQKQASHA